LAGPAEYFRLDYFRWTAGRIRGDEAASGLVKNFA
jgi:hypothetical protein